MRRLFSLLLASVSLLALEGTVNSVSIWSRRPGLYGDGKEPGRGKPMAIAPDELKLERRAMHDHQYGREMRYRGLPLTRLLARYKKAAHDDLALLRFENGMQIAVPLDFDAFLALEVCEPKGRCSKDFPAIPKDDDFSRAEDPRPITFSWNKIAVAQSAAPFSPWRHADTLIGIELVNAAAYDRQFDVDEPIGYDVFKDRCASCHGVRQVGASFGWDVAGPIPLFEKRPPGQLLNHVKYPKVRALPMGLMMPPQKDVNASDIDEVWLLFRKLARTPLKRYAP